MTGAIISGYQGIGKSTLAAEGRGYIDLESGNFFVFGKRDENWYIPYCNIAVHLAKQGYRVFVSSHEVVRKCLPVLATGVPLLVCFPSYSLKQQWIDRLEKRWATSGLDKDFRALKNAESRYEENIKELSGSVGFIPVCLIDMCYDLERVIDDTLWFAQGDPDD